MRRSFRILVFSLFGLIAAATQSPLVAQTVPSAAEIVAAAQRSSLHRNTVAAAGIGRLGLSQVDLGNGMTMQFARYLELSTLSRTFQFSRLNRPDIVGRILRDTPRINERVSQLTDRIVVDRRIVLDLTRGACNQRRLPKAVASLCFRSKRGRLSQDLRNELTTIRNRLGKRNPRDLVRPGLTVQQARALSDADLLDVLLNSGRKEVRHVSVLPLAAFARYPVGARPRLTPNTLNFRRRLRVPGPRDFQLRPGVRLETRIPAPRLPQSDPSVRSRPAQKTIKFPERHFLSGFTFGHEFSDTFEYTFADETWLTDRYFVRFSYNLGAGFGLRIPIGVSVEAASAVRVLVGADDDKVRTIAEREALQKRKKPARNVTLVARAINVHSDGSPSYRAAGLPSTQTFGGNEFVLGLSAGCSFYASIPGPDLDFSCPSINYDEHRNLNPVLGRQRSRLETFWIPGETLGLGYGITPNNGAWLDLGVAAEMSEGKVGFKITPKGNTSFGRLRHGTLWRDSRQPLRFVVRHKNVERSRFSDQIGFTISEPKFRFRAQITPQARIRLMLDLGVYALNETVGPFAVDALSVGTTFTLDRHDGTVGSYEFPM